MKYIYHYHASYQNQLDEGVGHVDGLIIRIFPVLNMEDYSSIKKSIVEQFGLGIPANQLTIETLTKLETIDA